LNRNVDALELVRRIARVSARYVLACTMLVAAGPSFMDARDKAPRPDPPADELRIRAALGMWEYSYAEFNRLVRLARADVIRFQGLLRTAATEDRRRGISLLLALNCGLPPGSPKMAPLQEYRCGGRQYQAFERWATSARGDLYALAFARAADQPAAIRTLRGKVRALGKAPVDRVADQEFLAELIAYLEEGGLP